ncbi:MAG: tRNA (adenosine(37)-N6)-threonylcarbamoyltransferase complex ATPase subunit type 1 TsaE [Chloroflexi bacterium]|nr:tRNA (adenosine(37)-N6)-threonylcarbamoyltransferase complex ATPase subunit type 1 TsaE [Chloroflexota bacterium]MCY3696960.1 tRNA (adenosine(37)-N6)-threonylcarbamoyltransferase complex ATPase subunit type 1 TsaE [Chloroflexota bacterium]MXX32171.1 tRNA (adenosine(37)-N6)-threonylcarbamoyltransferase complex ATPase subunit type 1 TsaE [Chloroflexota bacterium]MXX80366.1 tRNA (adenosine(37)-N6)-threonylcarbamoyltransferase complex ATPase subunit type 1 TsaE [Chloroflexota bacterium]MYB23106.
MPEHSSTYRTTCADAEATRELGAALGRNASPGTTVLLQGDLGAGKTVFAQGVGRGLDAPTVVNSPTFVLVNEHLGGRLPMRHADLYRLDDLDLIAELGLDQAAEGGVLLVEWPERGQAALPADHIRVQITPLEEDPSEDALDASPRELLLTASGEQAESLLQLLTEQFALATA